MFLLNQKSYHVFVCCIVLIFPQDFSLAMVILQEWFDTDFFAELDESVVVFSSSAFSKDPHFSASDWLVALVG